ncbi:MAG TPA: aldehyde dehydrogenase family protein, partial [Steroidobacteraceae bacterium]|nr:aldehyde dehydrogenase family protein [Steroidobacteraceae bacterium]
MLAATKVDLKPGRLLIDGNWIAGSKHFDTINPATGEVLTRVAEASPADVDRAVDAARRAFEDRNGPWRKLSASERGRLLWKLADLIEKNIDELAELETLDNGKPIFESRYVDMPMVIDVLRYYAGLATKIHGETVNTFETAFTYTLREPVGVVGLIVPWNFPMPILSWGMAPALAAGCTVVAKPAEMTPLTAMRIGSLALEAGLPEGVFQVLPGKGSVVGQRLVDHPAVRKIVFTGSTEVGQSIMTGCARQIKRLTLELGGKSANIIFADADLERAAATAPYAVFDNAGQDCCARSRILVQASVLDRFMGLFETAVSGVAVGDPASAATEMGPLISAAHRAHVASFVPSDAPVAFRGRAPSG